MFEPSDGWPKRIRVAVLSGIGDLLWSMTKVRSLKQEMDAGFVEISIQNTGLNRSREFVSAYSFVDEVNYHDFPIHYPGIPEVSPEGPYVYIASQPNFGINGYHADWLLIANGHLERGMRLEWWLNQFETDFTIGKQWSHSGTDILLADIEREKIGPYCCFFMGSWRSSTKDGHNRNSLMSLSDWEQLAYLVHDMGLDVMLVGAAYDKQLSDSLIVKLRHAPWVHDFVGKCSVGRTFAHTLLGEFLVSFQSGIGIHSVYMGVPTIMFWRPWKDSISPRVYLTFRESMAHAWAPPWALTNGRYLPQIYTRFTPKQLADEIDDRGWIGMRDGRIQFDDSMCLTDIGQDDPATHPMPDEDDWWVKYGGSPVA